MKMPMYDFRILLAPAGTRRGKNLQDILSPTNQAGPATDEDDDGNDNSGGAQSGGASGGQYNGSYHCEYHNRTSRCDVCSYMVETSFVTSFYFERRFAIHGRNIHLPASMKKKLTWFVYLATDTSCLLEIQQHKECMSEQEEYKHRALQTFC